MCQTLNIDNCWSFFNASYTFVTGVAIIEEEYAKKKTKKVPPDGGWGWLVLLGATLVNVLIPGTIKSFGILLVEFLEVFRTSPATAMWIPSLCYFLYSSLGKMIFIKWIKIKQFQYINVWYPKYFLDHSLCFFSLFHT